VRTFRDGRLPAFTVVPWRVRLPSGAYVVKGDQVRWVPAVDATIVVLASLSLVRLLARTWIRRRRHHGAP